MLLYHVRWELDRELAKGKGRPTSKEVFFGFNAICRNQSDALRCLYYDFAKNYRTSHDFSIDDGDIYISRCKVDSRGFDAKWLYMDGIKEPIYLHDLKSNAIRAMKIF